MAEIIMLGWIAVLLVLIRYDLMRIRTAIVLNSALHVESERQRALLSQEEGNGPKD